MLNKDSHKFVSVLLPIIKEIFIFHIFYCFFKKIQNSNETSGIIVVIAYRCIKILEISRGRFKLFYLSLTTHPNYWDFSNFLLFFPQNYRTNCYYFYFVLFFHFVMETTMLSTLNNKKFHLKNNASFMEAQLENAIR